MMCLLSLTSSFLSFMLFLAVVDAQAIVQVLGASPKQSIDGFGCSVAFMGEAIQSLPATPRTAILKLLFSPTSGAGFSVVRTRISPYLSPAPGKFDLNADTEEVGNRYVVTQAKSLGATRFLATAWTPPTDFKTTADPNGGTIDNSATSFTNYAAYLSKYVTTYNQTYGFSWYAISPQNEPELQEDYESCQWDPEDFVNFFGTYLGPRFQQDHITARILAPETFEWFDATIAPTLANSASRAVVQIVAAHPYRAGEYVDGAIRTSGYDYFPLTKKYNKQLWATEYNNQSSQADSIVESLRIATLVHKHLTVPESNSFSYWWGATNKLEENAPLTESLIAFNASGSYLVHKRLWALGQFARFVRPGWTRIDATAEPAKGVHVTAFKDGATQTVIVAINQNGASASVKFNLYGTQASTIAGYRTSGTESLKSIGNFAVSQGTFTVSLPGQSITTFVGVTNSSAAAYAGTPAFITEFNSLAGSSGASGDLISKFQTGTIDPSGAGSDETAVFRQTNTAEYIQYPVTSASFQSFVLSIQRNDFVDGLSFAAVSSSGALTTVTATKSAETAQPGDWFLYTYSITSVPSGTQHIRIRFSATNAEWNPRLTRLVIRHA